MTAIGYVYKTTNTLTGEFYFGKREYRLDKNRTFIYLGSGRRLSDNVKKYGQLQFHKEIIQGNLTSEEMTRIESELIAAHSNDPKCLNDNSGIGYGGIYMTGNCIECNEYATLYSNSGKCMKCIVGKHEVSFCDKCGIDTHHYKSGKCMKCVSKAAHKKKWCDFCQDFTVFFGSACKSHRVVLRKNDDGTIDLIYKRSHAVPRIIMSDVEHNRDKVSFIDTPKSRIYDLTKLSMKTKSQGLDTDLLGVLFNRDVTNWIKITYAFDKRSDHSRSITVTTDHPFISDEGNVVYADELTLGSRIKRVRALQMGDNGKQYEYAEVIRLEPVEQRCRSYDITTGTGRFDVNDDLVSHNCRSFLTPDRFTPEEQPHKYYGRFNQGVVTLNLPYVAMLSGGDINKFWSLLDKYIELAHTGLRARHEHLLGTLSDVAPTLWQHGALARLQPGETIDKFLVGGYSTLSLGYAGLAETVHYLTGHSHTEDDGRELGLAIMQKLNDACDEWKTEEDIDYSVYGTPLESTTQKFANALKKRFGVVEGVSDKPYITNSYHVHVTEPIDAFSKLEKEAEFQCLSPGGAISYIEAPNLTGNIDAVLAVIRCMYDTIMYSEINTKLDVCNECGFEGEALPVHDSHEYGWECPVCHNRNEKTLHVIRRTCGYIGTHYWNQGRTAEIQDRVLHL